MTPAMGGHQKPNRGETDTWLTPHYIIDILGPFDLDPCAAPDPKPWPTAKRHITWPDDGLFAPWSGRVWLNPPYGTVTGDWLKRLADHGSGMALIFARTETDAWHRHVWPRASAILFLRGRIHFCYTDGRRAAFNAGAPSAIVAYSDQDAKWLERMALSGRIVHLPRAVSGPDNG